MKFAVVSHILPPSASGQSMVLHRILEGVDPRNYCLLSVKDYTAAADELTAGRLPARYYRLPLAPLGGALNLPLIRYAKNAANAGLGLATRAAAIERILRAERCDAVIACSGDPLDLPAAFLASRQVGLPFFPYMFDDFGSQFLRGVYRMFAKFWQPILVRRAAGVIAPNEHLRDQYRRDYGVESTVIHNSVEVPGEEELLQRAAAPWPRHPEAPRILYTGAIYAAHYDAFQNLLAALDQIGPQAPFLHCYTAESHEALSRDHGIRGRVEFHPHVPLAESNRLQRAADILLLPLAFDCPYPELVRTSAPGKIGEYLCSGRPVLVHAPADSFISWYFRRHECGVVVDRKEPSLLADALRRLIADADWRSRLVSNAIQRARVDFSASVARQAVLEMLHSCRGRQRNAS